MKIADLLKKEIMIMDLHSTTKREVIDEMIANLKAKNMISNEEIFRREILNREEMTSTGLGGGVAMPHAKTSAVNTACVLFAKKPLIVAVTACPTGIAHTYMAEDSLKEKAAQMGVSIRVETNGSDGAKNILTADEIARSVGVIVAADKNVEMEHLLF